ncbi:MAG: hypothetical protein WC860_05620 [Candidatus Margulisiibacteriota bacterium]|jgi:hypothetical protein
MKCRCCFPSKKVYSPKEMQTPVPGPKVVLLHISKSTGSLPKLNTTAANSEASTSSRISLNIQNSTEILPSTSKTSPRRPISPTASSSSSTSLPLTQGISPRPVSSSPRIAEETLAIRSQIDALVHDYVKGENPSCLGFNPNRLRLKQEAGKNPEYQKQLSAYIINSFKEIYQTPPKAKQITEKEAQKLCTVFNDTQSPLRANVDTTSEGKLRISVGKRITSFQLLNGASMVVSPSELFIGMYDGGIRLPYTAEKL